VKQSHPARHRVFQDLLFDFGRFVFQFIKAKGKGTYEGCSSLLLGGFDWDISFQVVSECCKELFKGIWGQSTGERWKLLPV
jgi:hypothetical protein